MAGRRESPLDPEGGPLQRLALGLRTLRVEAGSPTYREMAGRTGCGASTLSQAAGGERLPSLPTLLAYVRACGGDLEEWERRWHQAARDVAAAGERPQDDNGAAPYRGLERFGPGDRDLFFGRDELVARLVRMVRDHRLVAVVGASGSGKSSLLRAGLIPALQNEQGPARRPAAIRILTPGPRPATAHARLLEPAPGQGDTVVVIDQFEELFTLGADRAERTAFLDMLLTAAAPDGRLRVAIGVRADFFGHCAEHTGLAEALREATLLVAPMGEAGLREAIVKPAAAAGLIVERALTARIIAEAAQEPGSLPLMSHALLETWRRRRGRALTEEMYDATGGIHGAIATTAEDIYTRLTPQQASAARSILLRLVTPGEGTPDTRCPTPRTELDTTPDPHHTALVLERLARARLLTLDDDTVDLAHEALLTAWPRYRTWIEEDRETLRLHRRLTEAARTWDELGRDAGALYRGSRLAAASDAFDGHERRDALTSLEAVFLDTSTTARDREARAAARTTRRLHTLTITLSAFLILALTAGMIAWRQSQASDQARHRAVAAQHVALSRQLAAQSTALLDTNPDLASLLAVQAYRTSPTSEATASLYAAAAIPLQRTITGQHGVQSVVFSPDGRTLATLSTSSVRLWDTATGRVRATLGQGFMMSMVFSPDGRTLATGTNDGSVRLWDTTTGRIRATLSSGSMGSMVFSPDGRTLATGSKGDNTVRLWDTATGRARTTFTGPRDRVQSVAFSPDGRTLAGGSKDGRVQLWDAATGRTRTTLTGQGYLRSVGFSADGHTLVTSNYSGTVRLMDTATGQTRASLGRAFVGEVAFSPDRRTLATSSFGSGTVRLWDTATGRARTFLGQAGFVSPSAFSPDGRTLATTRGGIVRLWDTDTGRARVTQTGQRSVDSVAFSPDGRALATTSNEDDTVQLWDATAGRTWATLTGLAGHQGRVGPVVFSPDGRTLATGSDDGSVRLWDTGTGRTRATLTGQHFVTSVAFSPDGRTLATGSDDGSVRLQDITTSRTRITLTGQRFVTSVVFSPDGRTLATRNDDSTVELWDVALPDQAASLTKICRAVGRDLTGEEWATYLVGQQPRPVCTQNH